RFSQWTVKSLQGLENMDNPTLVREAGQIRTGVSLWYRPLHQLKNSCAVL
ncbi:unnamed protein product, partial [Tetraodon nigroviridis]